MSRRLKMAIIDTIRNLHKSGHSNREIARVVGIDRGTVAKYLRGDEESNASKSAKPDHRVGPKNACEPFRDLILTKLESGLTGTRIFQDLVDDHGFTASYSSVRRFIQRLFGASKRPQGKRPRSTLARERALRQVVGRIVVHGCSDSSLATHDAVTVKSFIDRPPITSSTALRMPSTISAVFPKRW